VRNELKKEAAQKALSKIKGGRLINKPAAFDFIFSLADG
jgi:hypothetical protein